jgi:hypothetical protein
MNACELDYLVVAFTLDLDPSTDPSALTGPAFRGALNRRLLRLACATSTHQCRGCDLERHCPYPLLFDPPAPAWPRRGSATPELPLVLRTPVVAGTSARFVITLVGRAMAHLPLVAQAVRLMGARFSRSHGAFTVRRVELRQPDGTWRLAFVDDRTTIGASCVHRFRAEAPSRPAVTPAVMRLRFVTPCDLRHEGLSIRQPDLGVFLARLTERAGRLSALYCGGRELSADEEREVVMTAGRAWTARDTTRWYSGTTRSARHGHQVPFEGLIGEWDLTGELWPVWPWVRLAAHIGVGKKTTRGCGEVEVAAAHA